MILHIYSIIHVIINLVGILTGLVVFFGLLARQRLDCWDEVVPYHHHSDQCDRFLFPLSRSHPGLHGGRNIAFRAGAGLVCPLFATVARALALDLHRDRDDRPLSQCFRRDRAIVSQDTCITRAGPDTDGAAISNRAAR